jgi:hypothetical protein
MANSYVDYFDRTTRINDQFLRIIVSIMHDVAYKQTDVTSDVLKLIDEWQSETVNAPPGLITLDLSGFWRTDNGRSLLKSLADQSEQAVCRYGQFVPVTFLNSIIPKTDICYVDTDTSLILRELKKLQDIFNSYQ